MKEFGVDDSWTQFLKISYRNLQIDYNYIRDQEFSNASQSIILNCFHSFFLRMKIRWYFRAIKNPI